MNYDDSIAASADSGIFGLDCPADDAAIILLPVPIDATTSYGHGTCDGPNAILNASRQVDLYDIDTGKPYQSGIHMLPESTELRRLNTEVREMVASQRHGETTAAVLERVNQVGETVNTWVYQQTCAWLEKGRIVGVVGGDHSVPFGAIKAFTEHFPQLGVLHFDAHADLRDAYEGYTWSHASIMHNVLAHTGLQKLVQVGIRDFCEQELNAIRDSKKRVMAFFDRDIANMLFVGNPFQKVIDQIVAELPQSVYVSFDIDGLDPLLCPHTGTPVPGGLSFNQACAVLSAVTRSGRRIVGFDLNEVAPGPDGGEWDANVGARLLYKLCGHSLLGRA